MRHYKSAGKAVPTEGFTLIELLVVISIVSLLAAILLPALAKVRRQARMLLGVSNQRHIVRAVNCYAMDNDDTYPESVATIGVGGHWNWQEPTMLTGYRKRSPKLRRSMSAYLRSYIGGASVMFCPNAPEKYEHLHEAWAVGEEWDNPDTPPVPDPVFGTYCYYWNYIGFLGEQRGVFKGPSRPSGRPGHSTLLVSDYFGYDHWRSPNAYGSCDEFAEAIVTPGTYVSSAYWSWPASAVTTETVVLTIKLHAGYTDGHVQSYCPSETVPMRVSLTPDGTRPYPTGVGAGVFYLPRNSLY